MKFLKWFYNPFKPHICKLHNGNYAVRKLKTFTGWHYLSVDSASATRRWWYIEGYVMMYCQMKSTEEAESSLCTYNKSKAKVRTKVKFSERIL